MRPILYVTSYRRNQGSHATGRAADYVSIWTKNYTRTDKDIYLCTYLYLIERLQRGVLLYNNPNYGNWHYHYYDDGQPPRGGIEFTRPGSLTTERVEIYTPGQIISNLQNALLTTTWDSDRPPEMPAYYRALSGLPIVTDPEDTGYAFGLLRNNLSVNPYKTLSDVPILPVLAFFSIFALLLDN